MDLKSKKVLVTGAGGFIGSHLTEALIEKGCEVNAFVRYNSRNHHGFIETFVPHVRERIRLITGDLTDCDAVRKAAEGVDCVFHLGALIAIPYSYIHPREYVNTNVTGTLNVLEACRINGVQKLVHTSTSEVYGTAQYSPIDEKHPLCGQSPYSATKIAADMLAESYVRSFSLPAAIIRPFNTYGPRQSARAIIPTIITQILTRGDIYLGATHTTRDFTYVSDTVEGFIKVAESESTVGEVVNIGSGGEVTIEELVNKVLNILHSDAKVTFDASRVRPDKSEVYRLCADAKKAKELTGWSQAVSLDDGLKKTVEWIKNSIEMYKPSDYII